MFSPVVLRIAPAISLLALLTACSGESSPAAPDAQPVRVTAAEPAGTGEPARLDGLVAAREEMRLAFKTGGVVHRILVDEGERITAGQLLAELAPEEVDATLLQAREQAAKAGRDLDRARSLFERGLVARQVVDDAATARDIAEAQLSAAQFNRRHAQIQAPGAGIVLRRLAEPGETLAAGTPVLVVSGAARGWVLRAGVADRLAVRLRPGDPAEVEVDAWPGRRLPGRIRQVSAASDAATGTVAVEIGFDPGALTVASGLVGRAWIRPRGEQRSSLLAIPVGALLEGEGDRAHVFVLAADGQTVRRVDIETAGLSGEQVLVRSGLERGSRVVSEGAAWLVDGARVRLVP